mmetsp:Transcript_47797/g.119457  ORF Transcript_47797/g.119457 Transcript_47797/m.119457 type:complete len:305 (-) Transcript_47797:236-1150(-)
MMSTGMAEMYSSATTTDPSRISRCFTLPSSSVTILWTGDDVRTSPPCLVMRSTMGAQRRSGWLPSRKAIWRPLSSLRKRFMAVSTTVIDSLSGSMKSSALAIEMKTSVLMRSGMPYLRMNSRHDSSSWSLMNSCPLMSMGRRAGMHWIFSWSVSIFWFSRMASPKLKGAGIPGMKSKVVNSPGSSCMAKIIWWIFHCRRSSMSSSLNRFIMLGYAPKKMCRPVSIQSPSLSCHALTLPPSTSRASSTRGLCPASVRYLAAASPDSPPPIIATVFAPPFPPYVENLFESALASRYGSVSSTLGLG